jgi:hypothetical protein
MAAPTDRRNHRPLSRPLRAMPCRRIPAFSKGRIRPPPKSPATERRQVAGPGRFWPSGGRAQPPARPPSRAAPGVGALLGAPHRGGCAASRRPGSACPFRSSPCSGQETGPLSSSNPGAAPICPRAKSRPRCPSLPPRWRSSASRPTSRTGRIRARRPRPRRRRRLQTHGRPLCRPCRRRRHAARRKRPHSIIRSEGADPLTGLHLPDRRTP